MTSLRAAARDDAVAVSHLSTLISTNGSLAQVIHELQSPIWSLPTSPSPRPPTHPWLAPNYLDRPDPLDQLLLQVALQVGAWRNDALQIFAMLLEKGADPLARDGGGRRVEWELEGRAREFRIEWNRAVQARKEGKGYEMPVEMKQDLEELYDTYLILLQEEDDLKEEAERARKAAELAQRKVQPPRVASRLSAEPSSRPPNRLSQVSPAPESAATKRPLLTSRFPPPAPKRPRLSSEVDASTLPDYDESSAQQDPTPEDIKPTLVPAPPIPARPSSREPSHSNSPAPPSLPPGVSPTFIRITRLPSWMTTEVLSHWLEYGAQIFATSPSPEVLINMLSRGYYRKRTGIKPPKPLLLELRKRDGGEDSGPEQSMGAIELEAIVGYVGREEAWKVKEGFDAVRILPLCEEDELVQVTLM